MLEIKNKCQSTNAKGTRCNAFAGEGGFCFMHDAKKGRERAVARRNGGLATKKPHFADESVLPSNVGNIGDVLKILNYALLESVGLDNSIQRGRLLVSIAHGFIEALKVGELELRLEAVENRVEAKENDMNIKRLRTSYDSLSMLERLALADQAEGRDDQSELNAINAASPKVLYRQVDYYAQLGEISRFRLSQLIVRLTYLVQFDFYFGIHIKHEKTKPELSARYLDCARMTAFLYFRCKHAWEAVSAELGLRIGYSDEMIETLSMTEILEVKEWEMETLAFSDDELREHLERIGKNGSIRTIEDDEAEIREALKISKP